MSVSREKIYSQWEWDQNEDEWHKLVSLWKQKVPKDDEMVIKKADYERLIKSLPLTPRIVR